MSTVSTAPPRIRRAARTIPLGPRRRRRRVGKGQAVAGWLFTAPQILLLVLFLVIPILMAAWVSVSDWTGQGSPFGSGVGFVGTRNYESILTQDGLAREDLMTSIRNNFYYVLLVVPIQTALALFMAVTLNRRRLAARGFFRTAFYFPSITSSVAISMIFMFLFAGNGVVNALVGKVGLHGPNWFNDPDGLIHLLLGAFGVNTAPAALANHGVLGLSWWDWLAGPSVAMVAIMALAVWTTAGGFMLLFVAALQGIPGEIDEAALIDGANPWQRFRRVTVPMLRPTLFLVLTLGLIGTWQVFDQIYIISKGNPAKTTLTPAYLSYQNSFLNNAWGQGAAISFILFGIIVVLTIGQRLLLRDRDEARDRRRQRQLARAARRHG